jgi:predicted permease
MWRRYARLLGPDPQADVEDELGFHIAAKTDDLIARGWRPDAARLEAQRQFGDLPAVLHLGERLGEKMERRRRLQDYWQECLQDVRYTVRAFSRDRSFAAISILILALGIGANVAVFSVVNTLLIRPLPFPDSQRLVWFFGGKHIPGTAPTSADLSRKTYTVDAYQEFQRNNRSFASVASFQTFYDSLQYKLTGAGEPKQLGVVEVSDNFFPTLGVQPALGRGFTEQECQKGGRPAALLSHFFWKTQFGADPSLVGKAITINGSPFTVVGVLPESFDFGSVFAPGRKVDLFVPAVMDFWRTWGNALAVVGRLKPGVTLAQAQNEADLLFPHLKALHPDWFEDYASDLSTLKAHVAGSLRRALIVLWSAVGLILLIVCVNLSNLQLGRAASRSKELAMRSALGAGRGRLIRQLLTESLMLSASGAVLGLAIAWGVVFSLAHQESIDLPLLSTLRVDGAALGWTVLIALVAGILFGLAPALTMSGRNLQESLKDNAAGMGAGRRHQRFRSALVVSEVALACVLLVGAGLLLRSFLNVLDIDLGFDPSHAAAMQVEVPSAGDNNSLARKSAVLQTMLDRVRALPGVESAGIADMLPLDRNRSWGLQAVGKSYPKDRDSSIFVYLVTPGYLSAIGMKLAAGRDLSWHDTPNTQPVVLINQAAARRDWPGEDALGKFADGLASKPVQIAGIVADAHESSIEEASSPAVYVPMTQNGDAEGATLVVRTRIAPDALTLPVLTTLRSLNPGQPAAEFRPLRTLVDHAVSPRRFFVLLVGIFAGLGVLLAALGIYGVISYSVTCKTQEIGVRMALGASTGHVQRQVLAGTLRLALVGIALGAIASLAAVRLIASLLYATSPWDPPTYICIGFGLVAVALASGYLPALRASRIDPMVALRNN